MTTKPSIDPATRRSVDLFIERIAGDYPIAEVWLYGSRARGDARADSDADVAVILKGPKGRSVTVATEMAGPEFDVLLETGILVSTLPVWMEDWRDPRGHSNPYLIANIKREGFPVFARDETELNCRPVLDTGLGFSSVGIVKQKPSPVSSTGRQRVGQLLGH